jgi:phospholipid-binding lipoprotein MlaA
MRKFLLLMACFGWIVSANVAAEEFGEFESEFAPQVVVYDPLEGYNRFMTSFNDVVYTYALIPISKGYAHVVPTPVRQGVGNVFDNTLFPARFINNLLQGKLGYSMEELARFLINSTVGIAGWNDVAGEHLDIPRRNEDLGQTLGHYGIGSGFYLVLPILGPSNLRDTIGSFGDNFANPVTYIEPSRTSIGLKVYGNINELSFRYKEYEQLKKDVIDIYPIMRDINEAHRNALIKE